MLSNLFHKKNRVRDALSHTRKNMLGKIQSLFSGDGSVEQIWEGIEESLITADVGVDNTLEIIQQVRSGLKDKNLNDPDGVIELLKEEVETYFGPTNPTSSDDYLKELSSTKPFVILVVGVNGAGKTTSIAKLVHYFHHLGKEVLLGAADTFRAGAIDQLKIWGERLNTEVIAHQDGGDPGAVAYDSYQAAVARGIDVLIIDTAGRLHTQSPLMEELKKVKRVLERLDASSPHQTLIVLDATIGQNSLTQAEVFHEAIGLDGIFLAKLDGTAKGGVIVSIGKQLGLPVKFVGTGEGIEDLSRFSPREFVDALFHQESSPS